MPITNTSPTMTKCFSGMIEAVTRCKEVFSSWGLAGNCGSAVGLFMIVMERVLFAAFTCILALGMLHFSPVYLLVAFSWLCLCPEKSLICTLAYKKHCYIILCYTFHNLGIYKLRSMSDIWFYPSKLLCSWKSD